MKKIILQLLRLATIVSRWLSIVAAISIGVLMVVNFCDIIGTKFFLVSVPGALDISEELMVLLTLLPIAYIALERGHIRITMFIERMPVGIHKALDILQFGIAALISGFITTRVYANFLKTVKFMQLKEGIDLPIWPANLAVVISFGFLTIVFLLLLARTVFIGSTTSNE